MNEQRAPVPVRHDEDFYAWTQQQAKLLRALHRVGGDASSGLDFKHVAEEIQDLGKAELRGAISLIRQTMIHVIKAATEEGSPARRHWRTETKAFHADLLGYYEPSMRGRIKLQEIWTRSLDLAGSALRDEGAEIGPEIPTVCPFSLQDFV